MLEYYNLKEDINKCLTDPVFDILQNFSLEESEEWYEKRKKQWDSWNYKQNPAVKKEEVSFDFSSLSELWLMTTQAHNLYVNLKKEEFNKWVDWYIYGQNIVVIWYRLKTFDEWLHDGLKDALIMARDCPEDWARKILEKKIWKWMYTNAVIHLFAEWYISIAALKRLWKYEEYSKIEWRNIEEDIEQAKKALKDLKGSNVTVLKLKV